MFQIKTTELISWNLLAFFSFSRQKRWNQEMYIAGSCTQALVPSNNVIGLISAAVCPTVAILDNSGCSRVLKALRPRFTQIPM
jgi:hypothetical protein